MGALTLLTAVGMASSCLPSLGMSLHGACFSVFLGRSNALLQGLEVVLPDWIRVQAPMHLSYTELIPSP